MSNQTCRGTNLRWLETADWRTPKRSNFNRRRVVVVVVVSAEAPWNHWTRVQTGRRAAGAEALGEEGAGGADGAAAVAGVWSRGALCRHARGSVGLGKG